MSAAEFTNIEGVARPHLDQLGGGLLALSGASLFFYFVQGRGKRLNGLDVPNETEVPIEDDLRDLETLLLLEKIVHIECRRCWTAQTSEVAWEVESKHFDIAQQIIPEAAMGQGQVGVV